MLKTASRPLTVGDYMSLPDDGTRYQLIEGELHMAPSPNRKHQLIAGEIFYALRQHLGEKGKNELYLAPFDVQLSDTTVVQPDICYFSKKRASRLTHHGAEGAPDLVVEILSPSNAHLDLGVKREIYARSGVEELWIVDPEADELRVYDLAAGAQSPTATLTAGDTLQTRLLPEFALELREIFPN
ncbi:Uma2 family endonuclease [soil metagenome]|nr:Uma2 family endonuclease [Chthoniobacterales bacterium]